MTKTDQLLAVFSSAVKAGGGIHTVSELAFMMGMPCSPAFIKFLAYAVKRGLLRRVVKGLYESTLTPPEPERALYKIIKKLRGGVLNYISLESQLSIRIYTSF